MKNVQDKYRGWETDEIRSDLYPYRSGFVSVFINVNGDFNKASGIRNLNWFNGQEFIIVGKRKWDRRGAVGTHNYSIGKHVDLEDFGVEVVNNYRGWGYKIIAAEIDSRAVSLVDYVWQDKVVVIFGEEGAGLSEEILTLCDDIVFIPGRGSVRSLNVSTTSGIFLYDYSLKRGLI